MIKRVVVFFDKLEDKIRARLSRKPILYAIIGAIGIILVWKGVWDMADSLGIDGLLAFTIGLVMLLLTGLLVSFFIGDSIIISGFKREKKLVEKTESEIKEEEVEMKQVFAELSHIQKDLHHVELELNRQK